MKLSIILVNWNTCELTRQALASVFAETSSFAFEVIVVDNASTDSSVQMIETEFPTVRLIKNADNRGFGKGNNQGLAIAKGEYLMFLNTDVIVHDRAIEKLVDYLDTHPDVMMVGPKLLNSDGSFQHASRRSLPDPLNSAAFLFGLHKLFPKARWATRYKRTSDDPDVTGPAEALSGAAMLFRREVYETIGGFDETFFMYGEDLDFCKRVLDKNWTIHYVYTAVITHLHGSSSKKRRTKSLLNFYEAMHIYYRKHYAYHPLALRLLIHTGITVRGWVALALNGLK